VSAAPGFVGRYLWSTDHKVVARQFLWAGLGFLVLGGAMAMLIRWQWAFPGQPVPLVGRLLYPDSDGAITAAAYSGLFSSHGALMIFFAVGPILIGGFGNLLIPLLIGARDMAFPRLNALSFWLFAASGALAIAALAAPDVGPAAGWTNYPPLSSSSSTPGPGQTLMLVALLVNGASTTLGAVNYVTTVITCRAPGMRWTRLPLSIWGLWLTAILNVVYLPILTVALGLLLLDRVAGTHFFTASGEPLLYQHLFWLFGHPEVYILILPVWGVVGDVLAFFARKPAHWYRGTVLAMVSVCAMAGLVYGHHMFQAGIGPLWAGAFETLTLLISAPGTLIFVNWMLTLWRGSIRLELPMLFALGTLVVFALGGLTGLFLGAITTDILLHDTLWVVGHFHLIMAAASLLGGFAAIYLWYPKLFGRLLDRRLGVIHFAGTLVFSILTFGGQLLAGMGGQLRRLYDPASYETFAHLHGLSRWTSVFAFALGAFQLVFLWNFVRSLRRGQLAGADPWQLPTLEWRVASPPPHDNFAALPTVRRGPHELGRADLVASRGKDYLAQDEDGPGCDEEER
jgi:cytochrome c oxidase subunit I